MIPQKKKTAEEIAALRQGLGIPQPSSEPDATPAQQAPPLQNQPPAAASAVEPIVKLDLPPTMPTEKNDLKPRRSLRKNDLPLAPAPAITHKTELPSLRLDPQDISQIDKREALAALQQSSMKPISHYFNQTASPFLYAPGYLFALAAGITAYHRFLYITPAALLSLSAIILLYIAWRKPQSRYHAALLFVIVFLILVFGALHYATYFQNAP